ncbi:MAG: metallophosphoesterase [Clostridia bacterium]|nr:metallophosphoesterase [Clostridia bacterium]
MATICALLLLALSGAAKATELMIVSDIHYMVGELYEGSDLFLRVLRAGDGKYTQHSDELMAALCAQVARERPDALVVTGDLSFNGERASHVALAEWFARIEGMGVPVWVIPGNYDINVGTARGFDGDEWYYTDAVTPEAFSEIYTDFMLSAVGDASLSYAVRVDDGLWVAMTDVSYYRDEAQTFGLFTSGHADWLEDVLAQARGAEVVTATHHSLLEHTAFSRDSFLMFGHEAMEALIRRYGVRLNLSGHMHAQHIVEKDGLTDAALGAFCTWPHRYARLTIRDDGEMTYEALSLDGDLLPEDFLDESRTWVEGITKDKMIAAMEGVSPDARGPMAEYATRFNLAYFSGTYCRDDPAWQEDPVYQLWLGYPNSSMWRYMKQVMNESDGDNLYRHWD